MHFPECSKNKIKGRSSCLQKGYHVPVLTYFASSSAILGTDVKNQLKPNQKPNSRGAKQIIGSSAFCVSK